MDQIFNNNSKEFLDDISDGFKDLELVDIQYDNLKSYELKDTTH